jgi:hypothetical protein
VPASATHHAAPSPEDASKRGDVGEDEAEMTRRTHNARVSPPVPQSGGQLVQVGLAWETDLPHRMQKEVEEDSLQGCARENRQLRGAVEDGVVLAVSLLLLFCV